MKGEKIVRLLLAVIVLPLVFTAFLTVPAFADEIGIIRLTPEYGEIGDDIDVWGYGFDPDSALVLYLSSQEATENGDIDKQVTAYESLVVIFTNDTGGFAETYRFTIPTELAGGSKKEDVHGGEYYVYATYYNKKDIRAVAKLTMRAGEITVEPEAGTVGSQIEISGEGMRSTQKITAEFDGTEVDIVGGDTETGEDGQFRCNIIIPESIADRHTVTVIDESGNKPEALFFVDPKITVEPASQVVGEVIEVKGTGFGSRKQVLFTFTGDSSSTIPVSVYTNRVGSFTANFPIPYNPSLLGGQIGVLKARDMALNSAEAQLSILPPPATISVVPETTPDAPGQAGMQIVVHGISFTPNATATVTYGDGEAMTVATATVDGDGNFLTRFNVPSSAGGSYEVAATDGTNIATSIFVMESESPLMPMLQTPEVMATASAETYFDWEDVTDPSGVTYIFQVGADADFGTILLEKKGLTESEYTLTGEEKLNSRGKENPYYWRVKAVDGAFNESEWTVLRSFYVGSSRISVPAWAVAVWVVLGAMLLIAVIIWIRRKMKE
jgi:hypothetical protein